MIPITPSLFVQDSSERAFGVVKGGKGKPGEKGEDEPNRPNSKSSPNIPICSMGGHGTAFLLPQQLPSNSGFGESHNRTCGGLRLLLILLVILF